MAYIRTVSPYPKSLIESVSKRMRVTRFMHSLRGDLEIMAIEINIPNLNPDDYDLVEHIIVKDYKLERAISFGTRVIQGSTCEILLYCDHSCKTFEYILSVLQSDETIKARIV